MEPENKKEIAQAEAVKAVAKVTDNAINKSAALANFLGEIFGPSVKNIGEICEQHTTVWKIRNGLRLRDKLKKTLEERGHPQINNIPLRIGLPLIDQALNEDEPVLQDLWANLLASSMSDETIKKSTKTNVEILKQLDVIEAELLQALYIIYPGAMFEDDRSYINNNDYNSVAVSFAVNNLERLGLISVHNEQQFLNYSSDSNEPPIIRMWYKKEILNCDNFSIYISLKLLGEQFMHACVGPNLFVGEGEGVERIDDRFSYHDGTSS